MDPLISASFIAAFFAGIAALFAPCCISVLLPTFFASIFKQKSTVFLMTFIYFLGLLTIFLPIGLGVSFLAEAFRQYHNQIFLIGALLLIFMGFFLVSGKKFALPTPVNPTLQKHDFVSIYLLGLFSGIATTCCAPVLAGVLALSVLPGSVLWGGLYTLTYVLGMVIPLFVIALFIDKTEINKKLFALRKGVNYSIFSYKFHTTLPNLISGAMFLVLGIVILYLSQTNQLISHSSYQISVNVFIAKLVKSIQSLTSFLPNYILAITFLIIFFIILITAVKQIIILFKSKGGEEDE
ncbi:MAG: hypothetical protein A3J69_01065 [Candidatus Levybacteria bacterium RIFCSPHIGHO2_02_FULL_42_12]|nr:MAG: hypothetical protein A2698_01630 [Candidatus Levybacteria bacterium RIFCSPHIGHO2_01_FULL_42_15]OGH33867.1 MAG: hypothetical protein A3J69_01065 [Candidatus Levybacteria bacterium RIFCSPHIGHO2_02_FULL_42_12]OGH42516.1 MAG: hypothetical protein A3B53_03420 [Candidatus Levybacteria bacterium RIFCSPLOWO2_01_FULL_42_15]